MHDASMKAVMITSILWKLIEISINSIECIVFFSRSSFEGFFASKGAAYAIPDGDFARKANLKGGTVCIVH